MVAARGHGAAQRLAMRREEMSEQIGVEDRGGPAQRDTERGPADTAAVGSLPPRTKGRGMEHEVLERVQKAADYFEEHAAEAEMLGQLPDATAAQLRQTGIVRLLQPAEFGGYEAHPCDFLESVMVIASRCGASGWVAGVVGVHPWELGLFDRRVQHEIWDDDPDTWIASPYAPMGRARPVDGGYRFSGRWPFSSGTDHCQWVVLGGLFTDQAGAVTGGGHFVLPRSDYEIVEDSWDVAGLKGTGSKDVLVRDAFVPAYRTVDEAKLFAGDLAGESGRFGALYRVPWMTLFPGAITASVVGMAEGALAATLAYQRSRVTVFQTKAADDPHVMAAIGEAASEIDASRRQLLGNMREIYDVLAAGAEITLDHRARARRDQVRAAWRCAHAVDTLFASSGGNAIRSIKPAQRFWRDVHAGLNHAVHIAGPVFQGYTAVSMGIELTGSARDAL
jgi:alkylation response protein AidB-like acyl-CoA dehydrogenase